MNERCDISPSLSFASTVRTRQSIRDFRSDPVPDAVIAEVLAEAQLAPSNCNTQPWHTHIVSGGARDALSRRLHAADAQGTLSPDFFWDESAFTARLGERRREHGKLYYENLGVMRDDNEARRTASVRNFSFFNAPHVALLFMPVLGDNVRVAGDIGMYAQTFLLSLAARGLGGVPQKVLGLHAQTIRDALDIPDELKLLFGISFGYPNADAPANRSRVGRDSLAASVTFHS